MGTIEVSSSPTEMKLVGIRAALRVPEPHQVCADRNNLNPANVLRESRCSQ